jgi:ribonuclease PH
LSLPLKKYFISSPFDHFFTTFLFIFISIFHFSSCFTIISTTMDVEHCDIRMRAVECSLGILARADGSVSYKQGNTHILVGIFGPSNVVPFLEEPLDATIIVSFQTPTSSGYDEFFRPTILVPSDSLDSLDSGIIRPSQEGGEVPRERSGVSSQSDGVVFLDSFVSASEWNTDVDGKEMEFLVQDLLKRVVRRKDLPRTAIHVNIFILHHDGCLRSAVFNAVNLALLDAAIPSMEMIGAVEVYTLDKTDGHACDHDHDGVDDDDTSRVIVDPTRHVEDGLIQKNVCMQTPNAIIIPLNFETVQ